MALSLATKHAFILLMETFINFPFFETRDIGDSSWPGTSLLCFSYRLEINNCHRIETYLNTTSIENMCQNCFLGQVIKTKL